jgi:hypothetical protein
VKATKPKEIEKLEIQKHINNVLKDTINNTSANIQTEKVDTGHQLNLLKVNNYK